MEFPIFKKVTLFDENVKIITSTHTTLVGELNFGSTVCVTNTKSLKINELQKPIKTSNCGSK